jgi:hypothetical protein
VLDPTSLLPLVRLVGRDELKRDLYIYRSWSCAKKIAVANSNAKRDIFALSSTDHGYCFYKNSRLCYVANACHPNLDGFLYGVLGSCGLPYRWFQW